jgi:hypothetical protein
MAVSSPVQRKLAAILAADVAGAASCCGGFPVIVA